MAGKTIDDLDEFDSLNQKLKDGRVEPEDLVVPARVVRVGNNEKSRTVQISLDNPLMLPEPPSIGSSPKSFDEYYGGAPLRSDGGNREWAAVRAIYAYGESLGERVAAAGNFYVFYPPPSVDLADYTDFCILYRGGWGTDLSPWFSLDAARDADYDLDDASVAGGANQGYFVHNDGPRMRVFPQGSASHPNSSNNRACISVNRQYNDTVIAILVR